MDVGYHVTAPHPVTEVPEEGSLPCPRSRLGHPADILAVATVHQLHTGTLALSILLPVCFSSSHRISAQNSKRRNSCSCRLLETTPEGSSLEKQ